MNPIIRIFMSRDNLSLMEATELFRGMVDDVVAGDDPEEVLYEIAGLELDYIFDLIGAVERRMLSPPARGATMPVAPVAGDLFNDDDS